jgi:hypothetical protein
LLRKQLDLANVPGENYFSTTNRFGDIQFVVVEITQLACPYLQILECRGWD